MPPTSAQRRQANQAQSVEGVGEGLGPVLRGLRRARAAARGLLVLDAAGRLAAAALAALLAAGLIDYALHTPAWVRLVALVAGVGALAVRWRGRVWPALRFRPDLRDVALRLEGTQAGERAGLRDRLAAAVDLARLPGQGRTRAVSQRVIRDAAERARLVEVRGLVRPQRALRASAWAGAAAAALVALGVSEPTLTRIGAWRLLWPVGGASWPKRTQIADATEAQVHALGDALALRGALVRAPGDPNRARVDAVYRVLDSDGRPVGGAGQGAGWRRVALTGQGRRVSATVLGNLGQETSATGALFEALLEPGTLDPDPERAAREGRGGPEAERQEAPRLAGTVEYRLETSDDRTDTRRVSLVRPPRVIAAEARVTPPAYAAAFVRAQAGVDLGNGSDQRAVLGGVLAGSTVELTVRFSKPVEGPGAGAEAIGRALGRDIAGLIEPSPGAPEGAEPAAPAGAADAGAPQVSAEPRLWRVRWVARQPARVPVRAVDEFGVESDAEAVLRVEVRPDTPAEAVVGLPAQDTRALPGAVIEARGEARDDVAVRSVALRAQAARPPAGSAGAPPEPLGDELTLARRETGVTGDQDGGQVPGEAGGRAAGDDARRSQVTALLDLGALGAAPGDEVWLTAEATDAVEGRAASRSVVRRVRVISKDELTEQVWSELGGVRRAGIRAAEQQDQAQRLAQGQAGPSPSAAREQTGVTELSGRIGELVGEIQRRARQAEGIRPGQAGRQAQGQEDGAGRGGTPERDEAEWMDQTLRQALRAAEALAQRAQEASAQAAGALQDAERAARSGQAGAQAEAQARAAQGQRESAEAIEGLVEALDQGQDAWSQRRALEQLIERQRELNERTERIGAQATGKRAQELSRQAQRELEGAAQEQAAQAQRAAETAADLRQRAEGSRQRDPESAGALERAAEAIERAGVPQELRQAAEALEQNNTQRAGAAQARAQRALEEALERIDRAARDRDATLRRVLADTLGALDGLISQQRAALEALGGAAGGNAAAAGLDGPMIRLNTDTLLLIDRVRERAGAGGLAGGGGGGGALRVITGLLARASESQEAAVAALRAEPPRLGEAEPAERQSLERLLEARAEAERADDEAADRQGQEQRAQLKRAYEALRDKQSAVLAQTEALVAARADRRQRFLAQEAARAQAEVRADADRLLTQTEGLRDAGAFTYAHRRIDRQSVAAIEQLEAGRPSAQVTLAQGTVVRTLQALIEALGEAQPKRRDFRDAAGGEQESGGQGGSQQQQGGLIPPVAQLKVLRELQAEALDLTRRAERTGDAAAGDEAAVLQAEIAAEAKALQEALAQQRGPGPGGGVAPPNGPGKVLGRAPAQPQRAGVQAGAQAGGGVGGGGEGGAPAGTPGRVPTLDELLGLPPAGGAGAGDAGDESRRELEQRLLDTAVGDAFAQAVELIEASSQRLSGSGDVSVATQRVQEDALRKLDALLEQARQQQQQQQSSSQRRQQREQTGQQQRAGRRQGERDQQQQAAQAQQQRGDASNQADAPGLRTGALRPGLDAARAAWGDLPARVRDALLQGTGERFSAAYEALTEEYYKRLAERKE